MNAPKEGGSRQVLVGHVTFAQIVGNGNDRVDLGPSSAFTHKTGVGESTDSSANQKESAINISDSQIIVMKHGFEPIVRHRLEIVIEIVGEYVGG